MFQTGQQFTSAFNLLVTIREAHAGLVKYTCTLRHKPVTSNDHFHYSRQRYVYFAGADRVALWVEKGFWKPYYPPD